MRRAMDCGRSLRLLARGTSLLHHFQLPGGEFQEGLRQSDDAIHRGGRDAPLEAGCLGVRPLGRSGTGGEVDGGGRAHGPALTLA
jgi:hypothetical protein